jgi:hypothetical protein
MRLFNLLLIDIPHPERVEEVCQLQKYSLLY